MIAHKMTHQKGFEPSTMKTPDTIIIIFKKMTHQRTQYVHVHIEILSNCSDVSGQLLTQ